MKARCDICDKEVNPGDVVELYQRYQTEDVREVCDECHDDLNKQLAKLRSWTFSVISPLLRKYIRARRKVRVATKRRKLWQLALLYFAGADDPAQRET